MQSLDGTPVYSPFLFHDNDDLPHGPASSDNEVWAELDLALKHVPKEARLRLRKQMPPSAPYTFTHGDLTNVNIMVENGNFTGIIDWEAAGYFPVWWEFVSAGIGLGQEDWEWKTLLRNYMSDDYTDARNFWKDCRTLSMYPDLDERGLALLQQGNSDNSPKTK